MIIDQVLKDQIYTVVGGTFKIIGVRQGDETELLAIVKGVVMPYPAFCSQFLLNISVQNYNMKYVIERRVHATIEQYKVLYPWPASIAEHSIETVQTIVNSIINASSKAELARLVDDIEDMALHALNNPLSLPK